MDIVCGFYHICELYKIIKEEVLSQMVVGICHRNCGEKANS